MNLFSFLNNVLSGQKSKARLIDGFEVSYRYSGKAVLFDPITMLRDLKYKLESDQVFTGKLSFGLDEIDEPTLIVKEQLIPSVIAKFKVNGELIEVKRCVRTFETVNCSRYEFFLNQSPLCTFQRLYDYGKGFTSAKEKLSPYVNKEDYLTTNFWKNDKDEGLFLEHFGHTQIWQIHSISELSGVWEKIG